LEDFMKGAPVIENQPADGGAAGTPNGKGSDSSQPQKTAKAIKEDSEAATPLNDGNGRRSSSTDDQEIRVFPEVGQSDTSGAEIQSIYSSTRQFIIYEAADQIRFMLPDNYEVAKKLRQRIADLGGLRASIEDWRCDPSLSLNEKTRAAREIAWALAQAFEDEANPISQEPKEILSRVDARLRSLVKSHYRKKYCIANLVAFGSIEVILILIAIVSSWWNLSGDMSVIHRYAIYGAFGGLGAFLSVITGLKHIEIDINLNRWEHVFAGATRILIGVVGAIVIGLALDSRLIDPTFGSANGTSAGAAAGAKAGLDPRLALSFILSFVAGFSESLVPNLLRRGEQTVRGTESADIPDAPIVKNMKP
jgi:hypothetical protein